MIFLIFTALLPFSYSYFYCLLLLLFDVVIQCSHFSYSFSKTDYWNFILSYSIQIAFNFHKTRFFLIISFISFLFFCNHIFWAREIYAALKIIQILFIYLMAMEMKIVNRSKSSSSRMRKNENDVKQLSEWTHW
jgi:hypothetical protein